MQWMDKLKFQGKLTLYTMTTAIIALLLATVGLGAHEVISARESIADHLVRDARNIATFSTAAVQFRDKETAREALSILENDKHVMAGRIFLENGEEFATYVRPHTSVQVPQMPGELGHRFTGNELEVFSAITLNGQRIGTVYLKRDLTDISEQLLDYVGIIMVVLVASLLITLVTTSRFKKVLTRPISELVKTTSAVAISEDYSLRAKKITQDELGTLTDTFNDMLSQIEIRGSALRDSEERFRVLFNSCNDGIAILDRDLNFVFANEAADMYWGMNQGPLTGKNIQEALAPQPGAVDLWSKRLTGFFETGQPTRVEDCAVVEDQNLWSESSLSSIRDFQGNIVAVGVIFNDITKRKKAEEERERLVQELGDKNAELERFSYSISHDLKSPLITIGGYTGLLEMDMASGDPKRWQNDIDQINSAVTKMKEMLDDLLELSRVGRMSNPWEDVDLEVLVHEALDLVRGRLSKRKVQVEVSEDLPTVYVDRKRFLMVMQNLIDNAVKFMGDQLEPRIRIGTYHREGEVICFVQDNGMGIDAIHHEKVFGLFDRLNPAIEGTGIGLSLVKQTLEVHGGRIWVESGGRGRGTRFCFQVPRKKIGVEAHV